jgi:hypothetical protein
LNALRNSRKLAGPGPETTICVDTTYLTAIETISERFSVVRDSNT